MDPKKIKIDFHYYSNEVIKFLNNFERITYVSTLLVENNKVSAHQSNGYSGWDQKFYYDGKYKDSLLIKIGLELTKIKGGDVSTVIWDDVLKNDVNNFIDKERRSHNIFHGVSFIYGLTDNMSMAINICTGEETSKKSFESLILPMRFALLNYFKDL
ncbi:hypothetical protein ID856_06530 [Xenorhabdus sp. 18]|uniref:hypothetical protein n=1 Tax=Xenorhabdus doucetiae TaxID=351671 RepID=UPI0019C4307A|nr:hypothetical protein [Xenorhabdus sp. 18]MBD2796196.1 hypothetical protein [Xenorhabdus sp. 18]